MSFTPSPVRAFFEEAPQSPALVFEADVTLVGDHRAELRLDRVVVQPNL
jgi:hypothetical protein